LPGARSDHDLRHDSFAVAKRKSAQRTLRLQVVVRGGTVERIHSDDRNCHGSGRGWLAFGATTVLAFLEADRELWGLFKVPLAGCRGP